MAAKLIVSDIRDTGYDPEFYPRNDIVEDCDENLNWLSPELRLFMETCIHPKLKQASIGQCITHAARPRGTLPPILFAHAVDLDQKKATKSTLQQKLVKNSPNSVEQFESTVIDGGALLYQVPWFTHSTYNDIANLYTKYILEHSYYTHNIYWNIVIRHKIYTGT